MIFNSERVQLIWNLLVLPCPHQAHVLKNFVTFIERGKSVLFIHTHLPKELFDFFF